MTVGEEQAFLDFDPLIPSFQRDTISSFTSRAIARSLVPNRRMAAFDERASASLLKACKIPVPRVYNDPSDSNLMKVRTPKEFSKSTKKHHSRTAVNSLLHRTI